MELLEKYGVLNELTKYPQLLFSKHISKIVSRIAN
jgi:hypothetical protein